MIKAVGISKRYNGKKFVLDALDLEIRGGEIFCLLGANGAGKTTTINLFLGFIKPTRGEVFIDGLNVHTNPIETKHRIAYIPEQVMLYPSLTGVENLRYFTGLAGYAYTAKELCHWLEGAGLPAHATGRRVSTYSKGMRQKVGIAFARAKNAKALLLDEPTSGLDPKAANEFGSMIEHMRENGAAILMATHDLFRARELRAKAGIMGGGQMRDIVDLDRIELADIESLYMAHTRE